MKSSLTLIAIGLASVSLAVSLLSRQRTQDSPQGDTPGSTSPPANRLSALDPSSDIEGRVGSMEAKLGAIESSLRLPDGSDVDGSLGDRLANIEKSLQKLQSAFDGLSLETASAERDALFRGEDGNLKADEYFCLLYTSDAADDSIRV
mgnify:CR=1 FL=1